MVEGLGKYKYIKKWKNIKLDRFKKPVDLYNIYIYIYTVGKASGDTKDKSKLYIYFFCLYIYIYIYKSYEVYFIGK